MPRWPDVCETRQHVRRGDCISRKKFEMPGRMAVVSKLHKAIRIYGLLLYHLEAVAGCLLPTIICIITGNGRTSGIVHEI